MKAEVWLDESVEMLYHTYSNSLLNICGTTYKDKILFFEKTIFHNASVFTLKTCSKVDGTYTDE